MRIPSPPSSTQLGAAAASPAGAAVAPGALDRLEDLRELIAENDRALVRLLNRRLELVQEIWREKMAIGAPQIDPERERDLLRQLEEANDGPLSRAGLVAYHETLLSLTKQELRP
ncbi:MAG TPA: chorismate mutase [Gaiellaceae bacterium]|nr:chorismate mutase [Gaiellaceae bacterium]